MSLHNYLYLLALFAVFLGFPKHGLAAKRSYIVYLGGHSHGPEITTADLHRVRNSHVQFLSSFLQSKEKSKKAIFYSYERHINGFAAILDEEEAAEIAKHPEVVSVFPNGMRKLHTTHSWDFVNLEKNGVIHPSSLWKKANFGEDIIIGSLDTGVWPESRSFRDHGYGLVPSRWKGRCVNNTKKGVPCNRKLIGARYFNKGYLAAGGKASDDIFSARDYEGHGTHTLSTSGGNFVPGVSIFGAGNGTAKGGSPKARVAAYKVCYPNPIGCTDADILQAFDFAIQDGVDVISLSLGGPPQAYHVDVIAIGAFHALKKNIIVVASAGNSGPFPGSVSNLAPWIVTVGASTMDRKYQASVELPNGIELRGESLSKALLKRKFYPLVNAGDARDNDSSIPDAAHCLNGTLDPKKVKGSILVCLRGFNTRVDKGFIAAQAGAVGMILCNEESDGYSLDADPHFLPAVHISYNDSLSLLRYINSTRHPTGYITPPESKYNIKPSPFMAAFSSRGPNTITPDILKPDITAPGVNILAAYSEASSPTDSDIDKRRTPYNLLSGTSMSCPHVSGIAGLLKSVHPDWSPAAIRSAIITTARTRDNTMHPMRDENNQKTDPLAYGAGHIRPNRAVDPGLVYDLTIDDHLNFLCAIGYNQTSIRVISGRAYKCPKNSSVHSFNYPSIAVGSLAGKVTVTRRLKNVGTPGTYYARLQQPTGVSVSVEPNILTFGKIGEEKSFKLTLESRKGNLTSYVFGELIWRDSHHFVRSPILVGPVTKGKRL